MPLWKYDLDIKYKVKHVIKSYIYIRFANLTPHTRTHAHAHATRARARAHTHTHTHDILGTICFFAKYIILKMMKQLVIQLAFYTSYI